jgi:uncharacterized protein (TIGR01370 family)
MNRNIIISFFLGVLLIAATVSGQDRIIAPSGDYNGDGLTNIAIFRPSSGLWAIRSITRIYFGSSSDIPLPGDYTGNGTTIPAIHRSSSGLWAIRGVTRVYFGGSSDTAVPGDYDGNGTADISIFRPAAGLWAIRRLTRSYFGGASDLPIAGDYDGDGSDDLAVFRPSTGLWAVRGMTRTYFGTSGDIPVGSDYSGDGTSEISLYRPSAGLWAIQGVSRFYFGSSSDWAVPGNYPGTGSIAGIFRPGSGLWALRGVSRVYFGDEGDIPVTGPAGTVRKVKLDQVTTWTYNISNVNSQQQQDQLVGTHFDMYVLEPVVTEKGLSGFDISGLVSDLRDYNINNYGKDPLILAYIDIGQAEDWRWYWQSGWKIGNPDWIVGGDPDDWEGCYPVAYWNQTWEDIVIYGSYGMSHVEESLKAGFDGIYMDWVEGYDDDNVKAKAVTDGVDPVVEMFNFIEKIRNYARTGSPHANPDYLVIAQNASNLYEKNPSRYLQLIDGIALEAIWYDGTGGFDDWNSQSGYNTLTNDIYPDWTGEVLAFLQPMKGKLPIFCAEYAQDIGGVNRATEVYSSKAPGEGFIPYCTRRSLAELSRTPYPPNYIPHDY